MIKKILAVVLLVAAMGAMFHGGMFYKSAQCAQTLLKNEDIKGDLVFGRILVMVCE